MFGGSCKNLLVTHFGQFSLVPFDLILYHTRENIVAAAQQIAAVSERN